MSEGDRDLLVAAAWLHDIGYAPELRDTGFHPLDGARHLGSLGAALSRLVRLVAHRSGAVYEAEQRGLTAQLDVYEREDCPVLDALIYADMTTGSVGRRSTSITALTRSWCGTSRAARCTTQPARRVRASGPPLIGRPLASLISRCRDRGDQSARDHSASASTGGCSDRPAGWGGPTPPPCSRCSYAAHRRRCGPAADRKLSVHLPVVIRHEVRRIGKDADQSRHLDVEPPVSSLVSRTERHRGLTRRRRRHRRGVPTGWCPSCGSARLPRHR